MAADQDQDTVAFRVEEPRHTPALGLLLGLGAVAPIAAGTVAAWTLAADWAALAVRLAVLWAGAILVFLSGVRRGLSFRTPGSETAVAVATSLWLFALGLGALIVSIYVGQASALVLLLVGCISLAVLDPWAARRGEAPPFFARLRPPQMAISVACLAALLWRAWT